MTDIELRVDAIAAGGAGIGRDAAGRAVFVQRTAPGDLVRARPVEEKRRFARARLLEVLEPAAIRRDAPCRHYDRCGGCTLEHIEYGAQLAAKAGIVADALTRIGGIPTHPPAITPSPTEFRYRNRVSFSLHRLRDGRVRAGFHELDRPDRVLDIDETCLMPEPGIATAWGELRRSWGTGAARLPSGPRLRLTLRGTSEGSTSLLVQEGFSRGRPEELIERIPSLESVWHQPQAEETPVLLAGSPALRESWRGEYVSLGGGAFLQVNRGAGALLEDHVLRTAGDVAGRTVVDAYCGVGLHARRLGRLGARVCGIELDPLAAEEARRALVGGTVVTARVEDVLAGQLPADLVVLNPPRTGVAADAIEALRAEPPRRIIYISCDPATLARDAARLAPLFEVRSIRCFDLFPQTSHVETVVELTCSIT